MTDPNDWTTQELAKAAGINQSRIRQILLYGTLKGQGYKRAGRWFIPFEIGQRWLEEYKKRDSHSARAE